MGVSEVACVHARKLRGAFEAVGIHSLALQERAANREASASVHHDLLPGSLTYFVSGRRESSMCHREKFPHRLRRDAALQECVAYLCTLKPPHSTEEADEG